MCNDLFDDGMELGLTLAIAEEMLEEEKERFRLEHDFLWDEEEE